MYAASAHRAGIAFRRVGGMLNLDRVFEIICVHIKVIQNHLVPGNAAPCNAPSSEVGAYYVTACRFAIDPRITVETIGAIIGRSFRHDSSRLHP